jgi:hypothetical protein
VYETVSLPWIIYRGQLAQAYREAAEHRLGHRIRGLKKRYGKERMERDMATTTYSFKGMYCVGGLAANLSNHVLWFLLFKGMHWPLNPNPLSL